MADPNLQDRIRAFLGTNLIPHLEDHMTTFITLLNGLAEQQQAASAAQQASFLNLHNAMARLEEQVTALQTAVANGDVSPEVQAAADQISTALADMKTAANTADDGFEPVEPTEPATPPVVEPSPDVPVEPTTDAPVEGDTVIPGDETTDGTVPGDATRRVRR